MVNHCQCGHCFIWSRSKLEFTEMRNELNPIIPLPIWQPKSLRIIHEVWKYFDWKENIIHVANISGDILAWFENVCSINMPSINFNLASRCNPVWRKNLCQIEKFDNLDIDDAIFHFFWDHRSRNKNPWSTWHVRFRSSYRGNKKFRDDVLELLYTELLYTDIGSDKVSMCLKSLVY